MCSEENTQEQEEGMLKVDGKARRDVKVSRMTFENRAQRDRPFDRPHGEISGVPVSHGGESLVADTLLARARLWTGRHPIDVTRRRKRENHDYTFHLHVFIRVCKYRMSDSGLQRVSQFTSRAWVTCALHFFHSMEKIVRGPRVQNAKQYIH